VFFSDGVFAVALTLSIVELVPVDISHTLYREGALAVLSGMASDILGALFTFFIVGIYWRAHHRIFSFIARTDQRLLALNLLFLLFIGFLPLATKFAGGRIDDVAASITYAVYMAMTGIVLAGIWSYATYKHRLIDHGVRSVTIKANLLRVGAAPAVFLLSIPVIFINNGWARDIWFLAMLTRPLVRFFVRSQAASINVE
jgi:uncharacterized membrane protein